MKGWVAALTYYGSPAEAGLNSGGKLHVAQFEPDPFQEGRVHTRSSAVRHPRLWG